MGDELDKLKDFVNMFARRSRRECIGVATHGTAFMIYHVLSRHPERKACRRYIAALGRLLKDRGWRISSKVGVGRDERGLYEYWYIRKIS